MKTLFKFSLLLALIIGGKVAKQTPPATVAAKTTTVNAQQPTSVVLVHQVLTSEPVVPASHSFRPDNGGGIVGMF
jgi:hypothetical protein